MQLTDFARRLPDDVWTLFAPLLPARVWCGNGRPPASNQACLHAVFYVLIAGIAWRMLPVGFPSYKTIQRRLKLWLQRDTFRTAWGQLAVTYERLHGINWDQILLDGFKKPAKKGVNRPGRRRSIVPSAARPCTERATVVLCYALGRGGHQSERQRRLSDRGRPPESGDPTTSAGGAEPAA